MVQRSNTSGSEIFHTCSDQLWGPPSLPYNGYWVSFPGVRQLRRDSDHPPPSGAKVKERVDIYLYSPSGPSRQVIGWTLSFTFTILCYHNFTLLQEYVATISYRCLYLTRLRIQKLIQFFIDNSLQMAKTKLYKQSIFWQRLKSLDPK